MQDFDYRDAGSRPSAEFRVFPLPRGPARTWAPVAGVCVLTAAALVMYLFRLGSINLAEMNGYGLISVLPVVSLVALGLLTLAFVIALSFPQPKPVILGAQLVGLVGCLYGVTALIESLPRGPIVWEHLGIVEYISRTGTTAPGLDGRFSWPGFFALVSFMAGESNWQGLIPLLNVIPLLSNLLYLLPLGLILHNLRASWQAKWFAVWLFCILNWVAQDYFSPQGFSYWLYLTFLAILITWFRPSETNTTTSDPIRSGFLDRWRLPPTAVPGELPARPAEHAVRVALLLLLIGIFVGASVSHQLTPFLMVASCTGLVFARRCIARGLPILLTVILAAWLSYMTADYWSGHLNELFDGFGNLWGNVSASVGDRVIGNDEHRMVVYDRIALTVLALALAALGLFRRRLRAIDDRVVLVLLLMPLIAAVLQSYGGEILMRSYLFSLPATCVFAAYALFPEIHSALRLPHRFMAAGACAMVILSGFVVARYGNERYEITRSGELAAVQYVYQQDGPAQILFVATNSPLRFIPIGYQDVERVSEVGMLAPRDPNDITAVLDRMRKLGPGAYLVTTRSQEAYLEVNANYPPGWGDLFRARLAGSPELRVVKETPDAVVYTLRMPPGVTLSQQPVAGTGTHIGVTPLTPVGVAFIALLLVILTARELWRLQLAPEEYRRLRPLNFAAVPLLVALAVVVVERAVLLA